MTQERERNRLVWERPESGPGRALGGEGGGRWPPHYQRSGEDFPRTKGTGLSSPQPGPGGPADSRAVSRMSGGQGGPSSLLALSFDVTDAASMSEGDNTSELKITIAST